MYEGKRAPHRPNRNTPRLKTLLPLLLNRRPPTKPPRHSLTRRSRAHMLTTTQHTPESWKRRTLPTLRSGRRFARGRHLCLAGTNSQLWHLATSQHLRLAGFGFFALPADVALCFTVCACTLLLCKLGVGFFFARALGDGAGCGDPVVGFGISAGRPVREEFGQRARESGRGGFCECCESAQV
jgi:hypothetical protein